MYSYIDDTIIAPASISGTGAICLIRLSGKRAFEITDKIARFKNGSCSSAKAYTIKFAWILKEDGSVLDEVLVSIFRAPNSYTGEDLIEISCHSSKYIVDQILFQAIKAGARSAKPGEFTQRAFINGKMDLTQAEAVADLIHSDSEASHRVAMNQLKGNFAKALQDIRKELVDITSLIELELDFSEEEVEFADRVRLKELLRHSLTEIEKLKNSFKIGNVIKNGIPIAIVGAPNTGKSTLLNALLGEERAIVSDIAGTTRDTIEDCLNIRGSIYRLVDTAGIRQTNESIEKIGIEKTFKKISEAKIILLLIDLSESFEANIDFYKEFIAKVRESETNKQKVICLLNKSDLLPKDKLNSLHECYRDSFESSRINDRQLGEETASGVNDLYSGSGATSGVNGSYSGVKASSEFKELGVVELLTISAKNNDKLDKLFDLLEKAKTDLGLEITDAVTITNTRHYEALLKAKDALETIEKGLEAMLPNDLLAQDLREALYHIGSITGEISTEEVLGNIFKNFCIGK